MTVIPGNVVRYSMLRNDAAVRQRETNRGIALISAFRPKDEGNNMILFPSPCGGCISGL